jgi:hypothetical protein
MRDSFDARALDDVLAMAGGDREFVIALVEEYLADSASNVAALKSTSSSVGALALAAVSAEIEQAAKTGAVDPALISAAEAEHASARTALEHHLETL